MRAAGIAIAIAIMPSSAWPQSRAGAYFCVAEVSAGLAYLTDQKKWTGTSFRAEEKFVVRLKYLASHKVTSGDLAVEDYSVTITQQSKSQGVPCLKFDAALQVAPAVFMYDKKWISCEAALEEYEFNFEAGRFLSVYKVGYVNGFDGKADTPSVTGGTCTKID